MMSEGKAPSEASCGGGAVPPDADALACVMIGGIPTARLSASDLARLMVRDCLAPDREGHAPRLVFSSNGHAISLAGSDPEFAASMAEADVVHADGMSVVFASRLLTSRPLPERVSTTDFFHAAARVGEAKGLSFYFLGGREEVNAGAYAEAQRLYPRIRWAGRCHGYFTMAEEEAVCDEIRAAKPDVLWLGMGRPRQERFAVRNRRKLAGVGWIKTCGGMFDFLAGASKRAPGWMRRSGLEWAWRVACEPRRLAGRYAFTNVHALWRIAVDSRND